MRHLYLVILLVSGGSPALLIGQETPNPAPAPAVSPAPVAPVVPLAKEEEGEGEEAQPVPAVKPPPPLEITASKIYSDGSHFSTLTRVNTGKEFIGLTIPSKYWFQASENGREILVHTDSTRRSSIFIRFHTNSFPEFVHTAVWPMVSGYFDEAQPVFSQGSALGRSALVFSAESGTVTNPKQTRCLVVPCLAGTISVTAVVYGKETESVYHIMKQLASSLQDGASDKEIVRSLPTATD